MEATAVITWTTGGIASRLSATLSPLQCAEVAASKYGFFDLDVDTDDRGVKIVATAKDRRSGKVRKVTGKGRSLTLAVENLLEIFTNE